MERPFGRNLEAHGYVVATVPYRLGTPGRFPAPLLDLKAAVRWLRAHAKEYGFVPKNIGAVDGSAGGTLVMLLGVTNGMTAWEGHGGDARQSSTVQAVVDIDGSASFMDHALINSAETKPSPYWEFVHGVYHDNRAVWFAASPLMYVGPASAPVFFIKSTVTQPILCGREEMAARLQILGIDSGAVIYPNTPHPFWLVHPWFEKAVEDTGRFLARHLKAH